MAKVEERVSDFESGNEKFRERLETWSVEAARHGKGVIVLDEDDDPTGVHLFVAFAQDSSEVLCTIDGITRHLGVPNERCEILYIDPSGSFYFPLAFGQPIDERLIRLARWVEDQVPGTTLDESGEFRFG